MQKHSRSHFGLVKPRLFVAVAMCLIGVGLAALGLAAPVSGVWKIAFSPHSGAAEYLSDVTCTSGSDCWAVGRYYPDTTAQTLIEHWNGTEWSFALSGNTNYMQGNQLSDVACNSGSDCWAVGYYSNDQPNLPGFYQTLIEHWNGTAWPIVGSPNTSAAENNQLFGVTCVSGSDCWAVGNAGPFNAYQTLVEHWNGTVWAIVPSPNANPNQRNYFSDVTCTSASDCWTIGAHYIDDNIRQTLIAHWNGTTWTIVTSPNTSATEDNRLVDVTCPSASDCWAVGLYRNSSGLERTLTEYWDGASWTIVASPNTSGMQDNNGLFSATCASKSDCWAVGSYYNDNVQSTLIEYWNGTAWKIVTSPNASNTTDTEASLSGVACASPSDCWAVGWDTGNALIEYYLTSTELGNISTRLNVQTGGNVAIAGFIVTGQPQRVLIRALGPTIAKPPFNVPNTLENPKLVLYDQTQTAIASNDDWENTVIDGTVITKDQFDAIYSSTYKPSSLDESVIIATLPAGKYTAIVSGVGNTSGVGLIEVYNVTSSNSGSLTNISTRGSAETGAGVMIGGFIVTGKGPRTVLVRGLGPTLTTFGVAEALADPTLELYDGNGNLIKSDDNWKDAQQTEIQSSGFAPPNDLEPAIFATLPAGNYTAILRGKNNTSGVALVETYITN
jgi:hypothetical protein